MPARSLVPSFGAIGSLIGAQRISLMVIVALFAAGVSSVAFAGERRVLAAADGNAAPAIDANGCGGCGHLNYLVPSPYSDDNYRGFAFGPFAYANPENDAVTRTSYGDPIHAAPRIHVVHRTRPVNARMHRRAVQPHMKTSHRQAKRPVTRVTKLARRVPPPASNVRVASAFAALPSIAAPNRRVLNPLNAAHIPNIVVVKGRQVQIVSPDEINSIDLAADAPRLEQTDVQSAPLAASASPTALAQALSVIAGALAGALVGWLLIAWKLVRTSRLEHHFQRSSLEPHPAQVPLGHQSPARLPGRPVFGH